MTRGRFITLEGMDGAGKSSHVDWIAALLRSRGHEVVLTREPGGTPLGEKLRSLLLGQPMDIETETLLMFAARREHIAKVIEPALHDGTWVVSDRFTDATFAYQGGGRGLAASRIAALEAWVHGNLQPDLTLVFDLPVEIARQRIKASGAETDRFEEQDTQFFNRVREVYLERARIFPNRIKIINSNSSISDIRLDIEYLISNI